MKVIKEGKWTVPWQQEMTCTDKQCEAQLLIEEADVIAPDQSELFKAVCPVCGTSLVLKSSELPRRIKDALNKTRKPPPRAYSSWD